MGNETMRSLRYFDPETCRAREDLPAEIATPEAARQTVKDCLEALQPLLPFVEATRALRPDEAIQGVCYPWVIDTLSLLRHAEARKEIIGRAAANLRELESAGPWCLVYPAARYRRARELAKAIQAELGWPIVEIGQRNQKHFSGLSGNQAERLATKGGRAVVVDAMFRTGKTLQSLIHVLKKNSFVKDIAAFYVFDGSFRETQESLLGELGTPIRSLFRLPLGQPTEPAGDYWRERLQETMTKIENSQAPWAQVLREYCAWKLRVPGRAKKSEGCSPKVDVPHAIEEGVVGPVSRIKRAQECGKGPMVNKLDVGSALREPRTRNIIHGIVCNSTPMSVVEHLVLDLATQNDYDWLDYDWLVLHRNLFTDQRKLWRFLACIAFWIKQDGDQKVITRVSNAFAGFAAHVELDSGSFLPNPLLHERCNLLVDVLS
jgi:hypothetical protein